MKRETLLLLFVLMLSATGLRAQQVNSLPAGHYDARIKGSQAKWNLGDLQLDNDGSYSMSNSREGGSYKFSAAAQRVFFLSGPLKGMYASTSLYQQKPVIIFPANDSQPVALEGEVWAYLRK